MGLSMINLVNSKIRQHFTKESLLKPCICQIQGFSKDSLVKCCRILLFPKFIMDGAIIYIFRDLKKFVYDCISLPYAL